MPRYTDKELDEAIAAAEEKFAERFVTEVHSDTTYLVRDTLTQRVREACNDYADAIGLTKWLNAGFPYDSYLHSPPSPAELSS